MLSQKGKFIFMGVTIILILGLSLFVLWMIPPKKPTNITLGDYSPAIGYADKKIRWLMRRDHMPSVAIAFIDDQDTIWQETFGDADIEHDVLAGSDTVYKLWSVAKVFTALETMSLVEDGLVDLDAPITDYLPNFSIQGRFQESSPITIRSLLTHRSGLPRNECHWIDFNEYALAGLAASLEDCHQAYPVNYRYKYSNIAFDLLGYLIQETRGEPFPDYMRKHLFSPLGMHNSAFLRSHVPVALSVALGYEYYQGEHYLIEQNDITSLPSGNLYSTIEDMGSFAKFIFRGGETNGEQVLAPETLAEMFTDRVSNREDPQPMGLGWKTTQVLGAEHLVWHDGGPGDGVGSLVALLPERKLGVVLIANGTSFEGIVSLPLAIDLLEVMLQAKYGVQVSPVNAPTTSIIDLQQLEKYVGKYAAFGDVLEITRSGDHLKGAIQGINFNLIPLSETEFQPQNWLADLGVGELLGIPLDLRQMTIEFSLLEDADQRIIINYGDLFYETCPRLPDLDELPPLWKDLLGEYEILAYLPSGGTGKDIVGTTSIWMADGVLWMAGNKGPIFPNSETEIMILSGPFAGELMIFEPVTGEITHQNFVYRKR